MLCPFSPPHPPPAGSAPPPAAQRDHRGSQVKQQFPSDLTLIKGNFLLPHSRDMGLFFACAWKAVQAHISLPPRDPPPLPSPSATWCCRPSPASHPPQQPLAPGAALCLSPGSAACTGARSPWQGTGQGSRTHNRDRGSGAVPEQGPRELLNPQKRAAPSSAPRYIPSPVWADRAFLLQGGCWQIVLPPWHQVAPAVLLRIMEGEAVPSQAHQLGGHPHLQADEAGSWHPPSILQAWAQLAVPAGERQRWVRECRAAPGDTRGPQLTPGGLEGAGVSWVAAQPSP